MIFQIVNPDVQWYQYLINIFITFIGRLLDLLSTRYVSKELKLETNFIARRVGWKGMILMQIPILILGALDIYFSFFILWWSIFLFANNIEGSWYVRETGEDNYVKELRSKVKRSPIGKIILGELSNILKFTLAGIFIIIFLFVYEDLLAVFLISLALIIQGLIGALSSISYLLKIRKSENESESNPS